MHVCRKLWDGLIQDDILLSSLKADGKEWRDAGSSEEDVLGHLVVDLNGRMWEIEIERIHVPES